jgi:hypothetical protein
MLNGFDVYSYPNWFEIVEEVEEVYRIGYSDFIHKTDREFSELLLQKINEIIVNINRINKTLKGIKNNGY